MNTYNNERKREREPEQGGMDRQAKRPRRKRWGAKSRGAGAAAAPLPGHLDRNQQEFMVRKVRLDDIMRELMTGEYARRPPRSPSPPPEYDGQGRRTNTREVRRRRKLERERDELVDALRKLNPGWRPPMGRGMGRPRKYVTKVYIPTDEFPDFNFLGHIIGPRGSSLKQMEARTKARIQIRGKGSEKDGKRMRSSGSTEGMHAVITASTEEAMLAAKKEIEDICKVKPEEENEHKRQQLMLLAQLNGTLEGTEFRIGKAIAMPQFKAIGYKAPERPSVDAQFDLDKRLQSLVIDQPLVDAYSAFMGKVGYTPAPITPHTPEEARKLRDAADAEKARAAAARSSASTSAAQQANAEDAAEKAKQNKLMAFLASV